MRSLRDRAFSIVDWLAPRTTENLRSLATMEDRIAFLEAQNSVLQEEVLELRVRLSEQTTR